MNTLLEAKYGCWILLDSPRSLNSMIMDLVSHFGEKGPVHVVDGGNCFDAYSVARKVRGRKEVLERIMLGRAFNCYQVLSLLEDTPADDTPFFVLDMLRTFYDESVPEVERKQILGECIGHLDRLAKPLVSFDAASWQDVTQHQKDHRSQESAARWRIGIQPANTASRASNKGIILKDGIWLPPAVGMVSMYPPAIFSPGILEMRLLLQASAVEVIRAEPALVASEQKRLL